MGLLFYQKGAGQETDEPDVTPMGPTLPEKGAWPDAVQPDATMGPTLPQKGAWLDGGQPNSHTGPPLPNGGAWQAAGQPGTAMRPQLPHTEAWLETGLSDTPMGLTFPNKGAEQETSQPDAPKRPSRGSESTGARPSGGTVILIPYRNREHHLWILLEYFKIFFQVKYT
jgi:hypothetical protein